MPDSLGWRALTWQSLCSVTDVVRSFRFRPRQKGLTLCFCGASAGSSLITPRALALPRTPQKYLAHQACCQQLPVPCLQCVESLLVWVFPRDSLPVLAPWDYLPVLAPLWDSLPVLAPTWHSSPVMASPWRLPHRPAQQSMFQWAPADWEWPPV